MSSRPYLIVNMAGASLHKDGWSLDPLAGSSRRFVYDSRAVAERELIRLQGLNPSAELVLFEGVAEASPGLYERGSLEIVELTQ